MLSNSLNKEGAHTLSGVDYYSVEDVKVQAVIEESAILVDGHYQVKLPFRQEPPNLPESHPLAERRLMSLKRKFEKDPEFGVKYTKVLENYESEGSSKPVSDDDLSKMKKSGKLWYLPHHAVCKEERPNPRVVFDCAAKSGGNYRP
ncbi:uncharacterized protein LOC114531199 [Dendronephthya gigantea]|uniref:uncharacterized protein LOC114531199 n=1 Tax=Dendronephthya gigantea TaxID=151771 RepID=UPI00106AC040|nr:uncharacterized protein LOC114531199 [Dendronephthya gigantea]